MRATQGEEGLLEAIHMILYSICEHYASEIILRLQMRTSEAPRVTGPGHTPKAMAGTLVLWSPRRHHQVLQFRFKVLFDIVVMSFGSSISLSATTYLHDPKHQSSHPASVSSSVIQG